MTFRTRHLFVLTQQRERAVMIMIEAGRRLPALLGMAVAAELSDLGTMLVEVAIAAGLGQSKEGLAIGLLVDTLDDGLATIRRVSWHYAVCKGASRSTAIRLPVIEALHSSAPQSMGWVGPGAVVTRPAGVGNDRGTSVGLCRFGAIADVRMTFQAAAGGKLPARG
jgi:hypothetical protein